jgi:hypothetical protein
MAALLKATLEHEEFENFMVNLSVVGEYNKHFGGHMDEIVILCE